MLIVYCIHKLTVTVLSCDIHRSHMVPMWSWMEKVQPSLYKSEPVHGDVGTVEALIEAHSVSPVSKKGACGQGNPHIRVPCPSIS